MKERIFQAKRHEPTHEGLIPNRWYFWDKNFHNPSGGYERFDQAELALRQQVQLERQCPSCED